MRVWRYALAGLFVLAFAATSLAQDTTGALTGRVKDAQNLALPGVTITVTGPQGTRTVVTDSEGRFRVMSLIPGVYSVRAELEGFKASEQGNVVVVLGQTYDVSLTLQVGSVTETLDVVGTSPVVDTSSTTAGGILDSESLKRLPVGRSLADSLYLVPGVSDSSGVGRANPSIGGGSGLENNYIVDGVNITDTGFGGVGAYNSSYGSLGAGVTTDFVKETQIKTAGFEAEYGNSTGGVVNVVTKSGGNRFSGGVFGYWRPDALQASFKEFYAPNGTVNTTGRDEYDFGISAGGPIAQNRFFYFGTFNPQFQKRTFIAPEGFPYENVGSLERERRLYSYAGKLTAQINSSNRLDFSVFGDPSEGLSGLQRTATLRRVAYPGAPGTTAIEGGFSELDYGGHSQTVRYDGVLKPNWLVEGSIAHATNKFFEIPTTDDWLYTDLRYVPNGATGGLGFWENNDGGNLQFAAKSTHILSYGGNHQLRYGVQVERINFTRDVQYSGPPLTLADGRQTVTGGPVQIRIGTDGTTFYRATRGKLSPTAETTQDYTSFFVQDTWQIGRLTVRPGIRYDRQYLEGGEPTDTQQYCFEGDSRPGAADGTGPAIACNYTWENWSPRIGGTYDLLGNGRTKVYGAWGRFYAKIPNDLAARAMWADAGITRQNYRDAGLTQPVPNGELFAGSTTHLLTSSGSASIIDPDAGSTYKDEYVAGFEFEPISAVNLGIRYVHRTMSQILEDIGQLAVVGYELAVCGDTEIDYFITNVNASTPTVTCGGAVPSAFEDPTHVYDSIEFTFNKRFADNWGMIASYRFAKLKGNFEGFFRSDNGQSDPSISSLFDFPTNDATYTEIGVPEFGFQGDIRYQGTTLGEGRLPNDRPHQVKVYGNYMWRDLNLGVGFNWGSGRSLTALASNPNYNNAGEIPMTLRGEGFETDEGFKERAPADAQLDLHADYTLRFGGDRQRVLLLVDVFNLFNRKAATDYDNFYELSFETLNPNFGLPLNGGAATTPSYQEPLAVRIGARFEW